MDIRDEESKDLRQRGQNYESVTQVAPAHFPTFKFTSRGSSGVHGPLLPPGAIARKLLIGSAHLSRSRDTGKEHLSYRGCPRRLSEYFDAFKFSCESLGFYLQHQPLESQPRAELDGHYIIGSANVTIRSHRAKALVMAPNFLN